MLLQFSYQLPGVTVQPYPTHQTIPWVQIGYDFVCRNNTLGGYDFVCQTIPWIRLTTISYLNHYPGYRLATIFRRSHTLGCIRRGYDLAGTPGYGKTRSYFHIDHSRVDKILVYFLLYTFFRLVFRNVLFGMLRFIQQSHF